MTNEDKANQLYNEYNEATCCGSPMARGSVAFNAAMDMAQWKDERLKETLKKKMNLFYPPIDDYNEGKLAVLNDLYQELFNERYI